MEISKTELINPKNRKFPEKIYFKPVGIINNSFKSIKGIPISKAKGDLKIFPEFGVDLKDLSGFSHF